MLVVSADIMQPTTLSCIPRVTGLLMHRNHTWTAIIIPVLGLLLVGHKDYHFWTLIFQYWRLFFFSFLYHVSKIYIQNATCPYFSKRLHNEEDYSF